MPRLRLLRAMLTSMLIVDWPLFEAIGAPPRFAIKCNWSLWTCNCHPRISYARETCLRCTLTEPYLRGVQCLYIIPIPIRHCVGNITFMENWDGFYVVYECTTTGRCWNLFAGNSADLACGIDLVRPNFRITVDNVSESLCSVQETLSFFELVFLFILE